VNRIDDTQPSVLAVLYSPSTLTNGTVEAKILTDKPVYKPLGWNGSATGTVFTALFTENTGTTVSFTDLAGNSGQT
jgi:hypothetical protein